MPFWKDILFYSSIVLLVLSVLFSFLLFRAISRTEFDLRSAEETLKKEKTPEEMVLEEYVLSWQEKIKTFSGLINQRFYPAKALDFLGEVSHPRVWFKTVDLDVKEAKLALSGQAESFIVLGQQLLILENNPLVKSFTLSSFGVGETGKVNFSLNLSIDPGILKGEKK